MQDVQLDNDPVTIEFQDFSNARAGSPSVSGARPSSPPASSASHAPSAPTFDSLSGNSNIVDPFGPPPPSAAAGVGVAPASLPTAHPLPAPVPSSLMGAAVNAALPTLISATTNAVLGVDNQAQAGAVSNNSSPSVFSLAYYQSYFDVTSAQIASRLVRAFVPSQSYFYHEEDNKPDLYGPFWITTTLVFLMAAAGNFASYLHSADKVVWHSDFEKVTIAATVFYSFFLPIPLLVYLLLTKYVGVTNKSFSTIMSLYGYSLMAYIPTCMLCIIPNEIIRWLSISACAVLSSRFLIRNIAAGVLLTPVPVLPLSNADAAAQNKAQEDANEKQHRSLLYVMGGIGIFHVGLALVAKFYFFHFQY